MCFFADDNQVSAEAPPPDQLMGDGEEAVSTETISKEEAAERLMVGWSHGQLI